MSTGILLLPIWPLFVDRPFVPASGRPTAAPHRWPYDHDNLELVDRRAGIAPPRRA